MLIYILLFSLPFVIVYALYNRGYLTIKYTKALVYLGYRKKHLNSFGAKVISCSGTIKKVVRINQDKLYSLSLNTNLNKGNITVRLLDFNKNTIVYLDKINPTQTIKLYKNDMCYLIIKFEKADGEYTFTFE